jgi:Uma2 family endonuclease
MVSVHALKDQGAVRPLHWTAQRFLALVEADAFTDVRGLELVNGQIWQEMPQGKLHRYAFIALQRIFDAIGASSQGLEIATTVVLSSDSVVDPEFTFLKREASGREELPTGQDVEWIIEVSVSSRAYDLETKARLYATAGVPQYWVVDVANRGIWMMQNPVSGEYRERSFAGETQVPTMPVLGVQIKVADILPGVD